MKPNVRMARPGDEPEMLRLIHALASYEHEADAVKATTETLRESFFGENPQAFAHVAEYQGRIVGTAIWFFNYSTWTGRKGIYLEDLFVDEQVRGLGVGRALFRALARRALDEDCARIDWAVLDWNTPAMAFYRHIGGRRASGWQPWRLEGDAIAALAEEGCLPAAR